MTVKRQLNGLCKAALPNDVDLLMSIGLLILEKLAQLMLCLHPARKQWRYHTDYWVWADAFPRPNIKTYSIEWHSLKHRLGVRVGSKAAGFDCHWECLLHLQERTLLLRRFKLHRLPLVY